MAKKVKSKTSSKKTTSDTTPKVASPKGFKGKTTGSAKKAPTQAVKSTRFVKQIHTYASQKDFFLDDDRVKGW